MDDLGDPYEVEVDHFICPKAARDTVLKVVSPPPSDYSNLLASTSRYGHAFVASPATISVYTLHDLRNPETRAEPCAIVNLASLDVSEIRHVLLTLADTTLVVLASSAEEPSATRLIFLHVSALITGRAHPLPSPSTSNIREIAISPTPSDETQPLFVCLTKTCANVYRLGGQSPELMTKIEIQDAPCVAVSHDERLIAAGTTRGSVALFDPISGELLGTIVEVESGWQPFQLHFAGADYLFTTYESGRSTYDVIWHLEYRQGSVHVSGKSPLGELCYPLMIDDEQQDSRPRAIMFAYISEWHLAVVASSMSCDMDIVVRLENGSWGVWKLPEGFMPSLPMNSKEEDTTALGLALDFTDTSPVPPREQGGPTICPMPGIVVMSSDSVVISFRLVDLRPGANCDAVSEPEPLPPLPFSNVITYPKFAASDASNSSAEDTTLSQAPLFASSVDMGPSPNAEDGDGLSQMDQTSHSANSKNDQPSQQVAEFSAVAQTPANLDPSSSLNLFSEKSFTGTKPFLSNFNFRPPPSGSRSSRSSSNSTIVPEQMRPHDPFTAPRPSSAARPPLWSSAPAPTAGKALQQSPLTVELRPQLSEAKAAIKEDASIDPHDCIRSILKEMSAEFSVMHKSVEVMWTELNAMKDQIVGKTEATTDALSSYRRDIRNAYQAELKIRNLATEKLKEVIQLHEGYESLKFGQNVASDQGISNSLLAAHRETDQQLDRKEAEIEKLIKNIEDTLQSYELERTRRRDPGDVLQTIYSTISLQGLRIKRLLNHLNALSQRVEEGELDRRRTSMGLSIARLEKLSLGLGENGSDAEVAQLSGGLDNGAIGSDSSSVAGNQRSAMVEDDSEAKADTINDIFRKLAMRDGRSRITAKTSRREKPVDVNKSVDKPPHTVVEPKTNNSAIPETPVSAGYEALKRHAPPPSVPKSEFSTPVTQDLRNLLNNDDPVSFLSNTATSKPPTSGIQTKKSFTLGKPQSPNQEVFEFSRSTNVEPTFNPVHGTRSASALSSSTSGTSVHSFTKHKPESMPDPEKRHSKSSQSTKNEDSLNANSSVDDASLPTIDITSTPQATQKNETAWQPIQMNFTQHSVSMRKPPTSHFESPKSNQKVQFAELPPDADVKKRPYSSDPKSSAGAAILAGDNIRREAPLSSGSLFAHLPPDESDSAPKRRASSNASKESISKRKQKSDGLFATLPPDDTTHSDEASSETPLINQIASCSSNLDQQANSSLGPTNSTAKTVEEGNVSEPNPPFLSKSSKSKKSDAASSTAEEVTFAPTVVESPSQSLSKTEENKTISEPDKGNANKDVSNESPLFNLGLFGTQLSFGGQNAPTFFGNQRTANPSSASVSGAPASFGNACKDPTATVKNPFGASLRGVQLGNESAADGFMSLDATSVGGGNADDREPAKRDVSNLIITSDGTSSDNSDKDERLDRPHGMDPVIPGGGSGSFPFGNTSGVETAPGNFGASRESSSPFGGFGGNSAPTGASGFGSAGGNMGNAGFGFSGQPNMGFGSATPAQVSGTGLFGSVGSGMSGGGGASGFGASGFGTSGESGSAPAPFFGSTSAFDSSVTAGFGGPSTIGSSPWAAPTSNAFGASSQLGESGSGAGGGFGGSSSFGMTSTLGAASTFGMASPIGGGGGSGGGGGMSTAFGQSNFSGMNANPSPFGGGSFGGGAPTSTSPFSTLKAAPGGGNASPFAAQASSPSGFASIASSGSGLMFGDGKPPAFTSAAFSERRA